MAPINNILVVQVDPSGVCEDKSEKAPKPQNEITFNNLK